MTTGTERTTIETADAARRARSTPNRQMLHQLLRAGCTPTEALNLYAVSVGLRPTDSGWRAAEIERLRFLRHLVATGALPS